MTDISTRLATPADVPALVEFNQAMAWETERKTLDAATLERGVRAVFDDARRGFYLVAERDGAVVGGLMITYEWSDWRCGDWWWFQSVYVREHARRGGVFRALHADVEARARAAGAVGLRLYVEWENTRAQATYTSLGMTQSHYHCFQKSFVALG